MSTPLSIALLASACVSGILTSTSEINAFYGSRAGESRPVRLSGRITAPAHPGWVFADDTGLIVLNIKRPVPICAGDRLTFDGHIVVNDLGDVKTVADKLTRTGHDAPPPSVTASAADIANGVHDFKSVIVQGVITDAFKDEIDPDWNWLCLLSDNVQLQICLRDKSIRENALGALVDSIVSVCGTCLPVNNGLRHFLGRRITIPSLEAIRIVDAPPDDPFLLPEHDPFKTLPNGTPSKHRQRISGTVIATWWGDSLFLRTARGNRLRVRLRRNEPLPPVGAHVSAVGFVRKNAFFATLTDAILKALPAAAGIVERAKRLSATDILKDRNGDPCINARLDGRLVQIRGKVRSTSAPHTAKGRIMLDCDGNGIWAECGPGELPPEGSVVDVTGACLITSESNDNWNDFGRLTGFSVVPRNAEDIKVVVAPPWWTPARLFAVIGILLAILFAILVWNRSLHVLADRRGRALFKSQIAKVESDLRTDERTRLAVELHDSLAQNLTAISYQLATAQSVGDNSDANTYITAADRMLKSCRTELRRCIWDLRNDALDEANFSNAIRKTLDPVLESAQVAIDFRLPRSKISDSTAHALLCMLRELAANAVRHGGARHIAVRERSDEHHLEIVVSDDGCGFDVKSCLGTSLGHYGLSGIRERVKRLDGGLQIVSKAGSGTIVTITLPRSNGKEHQA